MVGDKSEKSGTFLFSRRVSDFCYDLRSFIVEEVDDSSARYHVLEMLSSSTPVS